jgi:hypothetical protein
MAALAVGAALFPQSAAACRIVQFPADVRAEADAAVIVALTEVTPLEDNSWRAKAVARRVAFGDQAPESFEFGNYSRGASCGPRPQIGDSWVLYLNGDGGAGRITAFYPLDYAEVLDPRIAAFEPTLRSD